MRRLIHSNGYSLIELTVTVALLGILGAIVGGQFVGQQGSAKTKQAMGQLDSESNALISWAASRESFDNAGSRLGTLTLADWASAIEDKDITSDAAAGPIIAAGTSAAAVPNDSKTMVFSGVVLDGERIRLTRCISQYFSNGAALCARVDIFPWGNNQQQAATVIYRFLEQCSGSASPCAGIGGAAAPVYLSAGCSKWPDKLPQRTGQASDGPASCASSS